MTIGWILGHVIATAIGVSLGLIGGGGSILAVPTLVYVMGVPPKSAIASEFGDRGYGQLSRSDSPLETRQRPA